MSENINVVGSRPGCRVSSGDENCVTELRPAPIRLLRCTNLPVIAERSLPGYINLSLYNAHASFAAPRLLPTQFFGERVRGDRRLIGERRSWHGTLVLHVIGLLRFCRWEGSSYQLRCRKCEEFTFLLLDTYVPRRGSSLTMHRY